MIKKFKESLWKKAGKLNDTFKWPTKVDVLWITNDAILFCIPELQEKGKAKGCFKYQKSKLLISVSRNG